MWWMGRATAAPTSTPTTWASAQARRVLLTWHHTPFTPARRSVWHQPMGANSCCTATMDPPVSQRWPDWKALLHPVLKNNLGSAFAGACVFSDTHMSLNELHLRGRSHCRHCARGVWLHAAQPGPQLPAGRQAPQLPGPSQMALPHHHPGHCDRPGWGAVLHIWRHGRLPAATGAPAGEPLALAQDLIHAWCPAAGGHTIEVISCFSLCFELTEDSLDLNCLTWYSRHEICIC